MTKKPLILIPCNVIDYNGSPGHITRETYLDALIDIADCVPLLLPSTGKIPVEALDGRYDGILLTGSPSHVAPACYGCEQNFDDKDLDLKRDATTLPLIRDAIARDIPLLAICRGFQELNVAQGGSLHQFVHKVDGMQDHRAKKEGIMETYRYQAHAMTPQSGGLFARWGVTTDFTVNTIHQQGVDQLGKDLHVEAKAPDGLIEAISIPSKRFIFGTQWHPEGDTDINPVSKLIFEQFGKALRA